MNRIEKKKVEGRKTVADFPFDICDVVTEIKSLVLLVHRFIVVRHLYAPSTRSMWMLHMRSY